MLVHPKSKTELIPNYVSTLHLGVSWLWDKALDKNIDMDAVVMSFNKRGVHLETIEGLGRTKSVCGAIHHFGDSVTGGESGDAETIAVTVADLDPRTACLVLVVYLPRGTFLSAGVEALRSRVLVGNVEGDEDGDGLDDDTGRAREYHLGDEMIVFKRECNAPFDIDDFDDRDNNMCVLNRIYRNPNDKRRWMLDTVGNLSFPSSQREMIPKTQYSLIDLYPKIKIPGRDTGVNTVKDLMNKMDVRVINKLEKEFSNGGLSVHEFIANMLRHVDHIFQNNPPLKEEELRVVGLIRELFSLIDVDGDGTMDWEELTAYVVQSGLMATGEHGTDDVDPEAMEMIFVRDRFDDPTKHGKGVQSVQYFGAPLKNIAVFDEFASFLRLYDSDCKLSYRLDLPKPTGRHKPTKLTILAACYIPEDSIIVISASDFILYFFNMNRGILGRNKPKVINTLTAPTSQISLIWNTNTKTLFSASVNQEIICWDITKRSIKATLRGHKDMIVKLCEIPELGLLASASLDDTINLYSIEEFKHWGTLVGHKKGVRRLAWGHDLLFSCGFEFNIFCWALDVDETGDKSASGEIVITLKGHEVMLLDIDVVPCAGSRIVSADISGLFKLWDVGSNARFSGEGIILQEFSAGYGFTDTIRSFFISTECTSGPPISEEGGSSSSGDGDPDDAKSDTTICTLIAGANDVIRFCLVHTHTKKVDVPSNVLFNPNTLQFFTQAGNDIHIWDASDGRHVHSFWNIFGGNDGRAENIECICFDTRRRKIISGSEEGYLYVFNSVSGASMKGIKAHLGSVVSVHYANESRCIVSTGTDRRVCVHDESGDNLVLLRSVGSLHIRAIECCAFSEELNQIATGSTNGSLHMIDYDRLRLKSNNVQHQGNMTSIEFIQPNQKNEMKPIVISADTNGIICIWEVILIDRAPGSDGFNVPLLTFNIYDETFQQTITTCITSMSMCSVAMPKQSPKTIKHFINKGTKEEKQEEEQEERKVKATTDEEDIKEKKEMTTNSSVTSVEKKLIEDSEILVVADENGYINEINLNDVWNKIIKKKKEEKKKNNVQTNGSNDKKDVKDSFICLNTIKASDYPLNQPEYNPKLRYDEYQYYEKGRKKGRNKGRKRDRKKEQKEQQQQQQQQEVEKKDKELIEIIIPVRRWQAHKKAIVTVVLTSTPPLILSGSEDETVHVWSLKHLLDNESKSKILTENEKEKERVKQIEIEKIKRYNTEEENLEFEKKEKEKELQSKIKAEEFYGELSHHGSSDDVFDEWHLPLEGLDLTSQHNKAAEELLKQALDEKNNLLLKEEENLKRDLELKVLKTKFQQEGMLQDRLKSEEIVHAHLKRDSRLPLQESRIENAMNQVNDESIPIVPTWQDYFQTIAEDEKEKAFSDVSLIRGSLQGMFGGEELQRLRMIRKRGMHHIYSFFPPAISGGDEAMPMDPTAEGFAVKKSAPAVYLHFRKEAARQKTGADIAKIKKEEDMQKALELARPSNFLLQHLGVKKRRGSKNNVRNSNTNKASSTPFFLTPIPSMVTTTSSTLSSTLNSSLIQEDSNGFFITSSSMFNNTNSIMSTSSSTTSSPHHLQPIQSAPQLHRRQHPHQFSNTLSTTLSTTSTSISTKPSRQHLNKTIKSRYGSSILEIQKKFDAIMLESDDLKDAELSAKNKKQREESKQLRLAKKERRASIESTGAKKERMDKLEAKREKRRIDREKDKKNDKRKRAWSKAGVSQKEVMDIITAFNQIDEDLTGEIDPKEFFALPQFSGFGGDTLDTLFRAIDTDGSGTVTKEELLAVMFPMATKSDLIEMIKMAHKTRFGKKEKKQELKLSEEDRVDITTIFNMYDTDNSKTVSLVELLAALGDKLRGIMTSAEIAKIFETFDTDKNEDLDLDEFIHLYEEYFLVPVQEATNGGPPGGYY